MALKFMCSYAVAPASYNPGEPGVTYGYSNAFQSQGPTGSRTGTGRFVQTPPLTPHDDRKACICTFDAIDEGWLQVAIKDRLLNDSYYYITINTGSTYLITMKMATDGYLKAYLGDFKTTGTLIGTSSSTIPSDGSWHILEFYYKMDDTNGAFQARLDGLTIIDYAGDTIPASETSFNQFRVHNNGGAYVKYADIVVNDPTGSYNNGWPNGAYCHFLVPNAAGDVTEWAPSTGSNYACVDEPTANTTDYVYTNEDAKVDTYNLVNLDAIAYEVRAVQPVIHGWREGNPTPTKVRRVFRKSSTNYEGSDINVPGVTMTMLVEPIMETDPATGVPFTVTDINSNIQLGIKSVV